MVGDRHVHEEPPVVPEDDEHEQQPEGEGLNRLKAYHVYVGTARSDLLVQF